MFNFWLRTKVAFNRSIVKFIPLEIQNTEELLKSLNKFKENHRVAKVALNCIFKMKETFLIDFKSLPETHPMEPLTWSSKKHIFSSYPWLYHSHFVTVLEDSYQLPFIPNPLRGKLIF